MAVKPKIKDPEARLDYVVDLTAVLAEGDTITSAVAYSSDESLVVEAETLTFTDTTVLVWVSGGTRKTKPTVTVAFTTAVGRIDERSFQLDIQDT